jgi:hypothetical protein
MRSAQFVGGSVANKSLELLGKTACFAAGISVSPPVEPKSDGA